MTYLTTEERAAAAATILIPSAETPPPADPPPPPIEDPAKPPLDPPPDPPIVVPPPVIEPPAANDDALNTLNGQVAELNARVEAIVKASTPDATPAQREEAAFRETLAKDNPALAKMFEKLDALTEQLGAVSSSVAQRDEVQRQSDALTQLDMATTQFQSTFKVPLPDAAIEKVYTWIGDPKNLAAVSALGFNDCATLALGAEYIAAARNAAPTVTPKAPLPGVKPATVITTSTPGGGGAPPSVPQNVPGAGGLRSAVMDILSNHRNQIGRYE